MPTPDVAALQDLLVHAAKGVGYWADMARAVGAKDEEVDRYLIDALAAAASDGNADSLAGLVEKAAPLKKKAKELFEKTNGRAFSGFLPAAAKPWELPGDRAEQVKMGEEVGKKDPRVSSEIYKMRQDILRSVKACAVTAQDARKKGKELDEIYGVTQQALAGVMNDKFEGEEYAALAKEVSRIDGLAKGLAK